MSYGACVVCRTPVACPDRHDSRALSPRTKMILLNTPHNPVGKVFTREELEKIAAIAEEHNLMVVSDEVVS